MGQAVALFAAAFAGSAVLSGIFTWIVRRVAITRGWTLPPVSSRHIHKVPTPRLGGVAVFAVFVAISLLSTPALRLAGITSISIFRPQLVPAILIPGTLLFAIGLVDDIINLSPQLKLGFQIVAGLSLYLSGLRVIDPNLSFFGFEFGPLIGVGVTVLWVVAISNGINIIDGVDGLASGSAILSLVTIFLVSLFNDELGVAFLAVVLAGALVGFLRFNFHPATIFLGDSGSLFIGFALSAMTIACKTDHTPLLLTVLIPIVALGFPIVEIGVSILRRYISGHGIFQADREHIHHRLLELGLNQRQVVAVLYGFSATCVLVSVTLLYPDPIAAIVVLSLLVLLVVGGVHRLNYSEFKEFKRIGLRVIDQKRVIANNIALRSASLRLQSAANFEDIYDAVAETVRRAGATKFELVVAAISPGVDGEPITATKSFFWRQSDSMQVSDLSKHWSFAIDLAGNRFGSMGQLRIQSTTSSTIPFDLNVFLFDLQPRLCEAVERAIVAEGRRPKLQSKILKRPNDVGEEETQLKPVLQ